MMRSLPLPLHAACLILLSCHPAPLPVERRVPVDATAECLALRRGMIECPAAAGLILDRRAQNDPALAERLRQPAAAEAARAEVLAEMQREATLPAEERRQQCRQAAADAPLPSPEDLARLHRCLALSCEYRVTCLRPLLLQGRSAEAPLAH